ncbi:MAG: NUDIX hydrolase [Cyclobacteriaceae bacterium]|nr:NUDIX hydrolase [Cyclobacteriaceae bacterium]
MKYCSKCGSSHIALLVPEGDTYERFVCGNCQSIFYANPRMIVGCLPVYEDKVMLCKRAIAPQHGLWNLPAGFLENGEKAEDGAARETLEESQAKVNIIKLHAVFSLPKVNQVYLLFLAQLKDLHFGPTKESLEVSLFAQEDVPWKDIAFHSTTYALERYYSYGKDFEGVHVGSYEGKQKWEA